LFEFPAGTNTVSQIIDLNYSD